MRLILRIIFIILSFSLIILLTFFLITIDVYEETVIQRGIYILSFLTLIALIIQDAFKVKSYKELAKSIDNKTIELSQKAYRRIIILYALKSYKYGILFGIYEILLYLILKSVYHKTFFGLIFFGFAIIIFGPIQEIVRIIIFRKKQSFPKLKLNYTVNENSIILNPENENLAVNFSEIEKIVLINKVLFLKTNIIPEYFIINRVN